MVQLAVQALKVNAVRLTVAHISVVTMVTDKGPGTANLLRC